MWGSEVVIFNLQKKSEKEIIKHLKKGFRIKRIDKDNKII